MLHMHLFMSFMMRALMALLRDILFVSGIGLPSDIVVKNGESYWLADSDESNWHCKAFTSFWQYFILANYSWILMEGLYLHNLVFLALFRDANSSIIAYVVLGWGKFLYFFSRWVEKKRLHDPVVFQVFQLFSYFLGSFWGQYSTTLIAGRQTQIPTSFFSFECQPRFQSW